jgi:hypothetical protein
LSPRSRPRCHRDASPFALLHSRFAHSIFACAPIPFLLLLSLLIHAPQIHFVFVPLPSFHPPTLLSLFILSSCLPHLELVLPIALSWLSTYIHCPSPSHICLAPVSH